MVHEIRESVGAGGDHWIEPGQTRVVGTGNGRNLTATLGEGVAEAGVVDHRTAAEAERTGALARAEVEAGIAARRPPDRIKARQGAARPGPSTVSGTVEERDRHAFLEGAGAGQRNSCARAERLIQFVIGARDQGARERVARDRGFVLLVLWEGLVTVEVDQDVAADAGSLRRKSERSQHEHETHHQSRIDHNPSHCGTSWMNLPHDILPVPYSTLAVEGTGLRGGGPKSSSAARRCHA